MGMIIWNRVLPFTKTHTSTVDMSGVGGTLLACGIPVIFQNFRWTPACSKTVSKEAVPLKPSEGQGSISLLPAGEPCFLVCSVLLSVPRGSMQQPLRMFQRQVSLVLGPALSSFSAMYCIRAHERFTDLHLRLQLSQESNAEKLSLVSMLSTNFSWGHCAQLQGAQCWRSMSFMDSTANMVFVFKSDQQYCLQLWCQVLTAGLSLKMFGVWVLKEDFPTPFLGAPGLVFGAVILTCSELITSAAEIGGLQEAVQKFKLASQWISMLAPCKVPITKRFLRWLVWGRNCIQGTSQEEMLPGHAPWPSQSLGKGPMDGPL